MHCGVGGLRDLTGPFVLILPELYYFAVWYLL